MLYRQLIAIVVRLLNSRKALALCRVVVQKSLPCVVGVLVLSAARLSFATTAYTGVVYPVDNPFDGRGVTGIPRDGNDFFLFEAENHQTYYEGYHQDNGPGAADDTPGITGDDTNVNFDVIVGAGGPGTLQITEVALRDMNLVIGDIGSPDYNAAPNYSYNPNLENRVGSGVVRITGLGAVYNSNFEILAAGLDPLTFESAVPRDGAASPFGLDDSADGFDMYVGRGGNGTLEISVGGRAEIHDSIAVGLSSGTVGNIIVDGFDSYLGSAGLGNGLPDLPVGNGSGPPLPGMYVGALGTGIVTVRNGGTMQTETDVTATSNNAVPVAVLGGTPSSFTGNDIPDQGGTGIVTVTGTGSKWLVGGTLQIGGFNLGTNVVGGGIDFQGDDVIYNSQAGRGTLNVADNGLVDINLSLAPPNAVTDPTLYLAIGRFGRLNLATGGLVNIGGGTDQDPRTRDVVIFNDGVISGSGRIQTGVFLNRYRGEVRVGAGERLVIDAEAEFRLPAPVPGGAPATPNSPIAPLVNYGVIQVFGTVDAKAEIEFDRAPNEPTTNPIQPMRNERVARPAGAPLTDFYGGLISAQHSILRFRSGLINTGMMSFSAGNNYVTGNVLNADVPLSADDGIITITGPGTKVTFENDLLAVSPVTVGPGATLEVLARHSFLTAGDLKVTLHPTDTSHIFAAGDAGIAGKLSISLAGFGPGDLQVGDSFEIISVSGDMGGVDLSDPLNPKIDLTQLPSFPLVSFPNLAPFGLPATTILQPIFTANSVLVVVGSAAGAVGPDFNGDGVVDGLDLNIWLANVGIPSGASVVQGDADADGDVDGDDFLFWQRNVGRPMPWAGAGSGSGGEAGVPEPASAVLLLISAVLSLSYRGRRAIA